MIIKFKKKKNIWETSELFLSDSNYYCFNRKILQGLGQGK